MAHIIIHHTVLDGNIDSAGYPDEYTAAIEFAAYLERTWTAELNEEREQGHRTTIRVNVGRKMSGYAPDTIIDVEPTADEEDAWDLMERKKHLRITPSNTLYARWSDQ